MRVKDEKIILAIGLTLFFSTNTKADICFDVSDEVASKAMSILEKQKEIYNYCTICEHSKPQMVPIKKVTRDKKIYVNGHPIDLAHTYFKQDNKYINLGIAAGCIEDGKYGISAKLDDLAEFRHTKEIDKKQAKQKAKAIFDECINKIKNDKYKTTQDMIERDIKINNCLTEAIKQEIQKGFNPKQQPQILEYVEQTRKGTWNFYHTIYTANKYCYGQCGSINSLLPYNDERLILMQMLEKLLYLNSY